ncbi:Uncharacterised protein [Mycobacteroides abscessus subsp. abscessus]|nr:Uncharacterised protein [Mycobacteroides abscessus subsp. abscessus]
MIRRAVAAATCSSYVVPHDYVGAVRYALSSGLLPIGQAGDEHSDQCATNGVYLCE